MVGRYHIRARLVAVTMVKQIIKGCEMGKWLAILCVFCFSGAQAAEYAAVSVSMVPIKVGHTVIMCKVWQVLPPRRIRAICRMPGL